MEVWSRFFFCDIRLTEKFLISGFLELLSEMLGFVCKESGISVGPKAFHMTA